MPDKTDHERILLIEQAFKIFQENYNDKLENMVEIVKESLADFKKELDDYRKFLNNGISVKIANQIKSEVNKRVIAEMIEETISQLNASRSSNARTRKSDETINNFLNKSILQKISIIVSIMVGTLTLSGVIGAGLIWLGNFLIGIAGLR